METGANGVHRRPANTSEISGQMAQFKVKDIWALRVCLQMEGRVQELALLSGNRYQAARLQPVNLKVRDVCQGDQVAKRATVMQLKILRAVQLHLGHSKMESTVRHIGIDADDTLKITEQTAI